MKVFVFVPLSQYEPLCWTTSRLIRYLSCTRSEDEVLFILPKCDILMLPSSRHFCLSHIPTSAILQLPSYLLSTLRPTLDLQAEYEFNSSVFSMCFLDFFKQDMIFKQNMIFKLPLPIGDPLNIYYLLPFLLKLA